MNSWHRSLTLDSNVLVGTIPSDIGALTALKLLSLSAVSLVGPIPNSITLLTAIT